MERFSPRGIFLKNARSLLKVFGRRPKFLGMLPMSPYLVGLVQHAAFRYRGVPVGSAPVAPCLALSQLTKGSALSEPPGNSVMGAQDVNPVVAFGVPAKE